MNPSTCKSSEAAEAMATEKNLLDDIFIFEQPTLERNNIKHSERCSDLCEVKLLLQLFGFKIAWRN